MKQAYLILGAIIIAFLLIFWASVKLKNRKLPSQPDGDLRRPLNDALPGNAVLNDKLVIVEDISEKDIKKVLQEFCNSYNKKTDQAIPRLIKLSDNKFAVTFPCDISFEIYCFLINYLNYPIGLDRHFETFGWATTKSTDIWITEKSANKSVMLYISDVDTEYDNVFLTTSDNIGYKLGFAMGEEMQLLNWPDKNYRERPINLSELEAKEYTDFK